MNIVLRRPDGNEYYVAAVRRDGDAYAVQGKCVSKQGKLRTLGRSFEAPTLTEARRRCRQLAKVKVRKRKYTQVELTRVPASVTHLLEVPPEMQLTPQEMLDLIRNSKQERYVVFSDTSGMEDYFDVGVQYLGYATDDEGIFRVHDRFGDLRHVFRERLASVDDTERSAQLENMDGSI